MIKNLEVVGAFSAQNFSDIPKFFETYKFSRYHKIFREINTISQKIDRICPIFRGGGIISIRGGIISILFPSGGGHCPPRPPPQLRACYRPIAHDVTAPVTMHLKDKLAIYGWYNFCKQSKFCTRTDIVREHLEDTLRICDVVQWVYSLDSCHFISLSKHITYFWSCHIFHSSKCFLTYFNISAVVALGNSTLAEFFLVDFFISFIDHRPTSFISTHNRREATSLNVIL